MGDRFKNDCSKVKTFFVGHWTDTGWSKKVVGLNECGLFFKIYPKFPEKNMQVPVAFGPS